MNPTYLESNLLIGLKSKKNQLLTILLVLFIIFSLLIVKKQKIGDGAKSRENCGQSLRANANYFDSEILKRPTYKSTYDNLNRQSQELANLQNSQVFVDPIQCLTSYRNLLNTMQVGYQNHYAGAKTLDAPSQFFIEQELNKTDYLIKHKILIVMNNENSATYLIYTLSILGTIIFFCLSFISSDSWIINLRHQSILKDIPYRFKDEVSGKIIINFTLVFLSLLLGMILAYMFTGLRHGFVTLNYPVIFYSTSISAIPLWLYCFLFLVYLPDLIIFTTSLSLFLSQLTKNVYPTIFIKAILYALLFLPKATLKWLVFLSLPYLNLTDLLNDNLANKLNLNSINLLTGYRVLLIWSIFLLILFKYLSVGRKK